MLNPSPFSAPPLLEHLASRIAPYLELKSMPAHSHEVIVAFAFYHLLCQYISPAISQTLIPKVYSRFDRRTKLNWNIHVVSAIQSILICTLSIWTLINDEEAAAMDYRERVWGYTGALGLVEALGTGYFIWDFWISLENVSDFGFGMLAHATAALTVFALGFRPFVNYYAPVFLLYELSTPFLNIHWFCDKLDMTGSNLQFYNGIILITTFFSARLVWGIYQSYRVFSDIFRAMGYQRTAAGQAWLLTVAAPQPAAATSVLGSKELSEMMLYTRGENIPTWTAIVYLGSNLTLTMLNMHWFGQMIKTIRKRFDPPFGTRKPEVKKDTVMGRGIDNEGVKTVELQQSNVRKRGKGNGPDSHPPPT